MTDSENAENLLDLVKAIAAQDTGERDARLGAMTDQQLAETARLAAATLRAVGSVQPEGAAELYDELADRLMVREHE